MSREGSFVNKKHSQGVLESMNRIRSRGKLCDVVIQVGEKQFYAHRIVLAANTPYFEAMFSGDLDESRQQSVTLRDVSSEAVKSIIDYCYTSAVHISGDNAECLLSASCLLQIDGVKDACCAYMKKKLDADNCLSVRSLAEVYSCQELFEMANAFSQEHYAEVMKGEEFMNLTADELASLVASDELNVPSEELVFESVLRWAKHGASSREAQLAAVLHHVRLPLLTPSYLVSQVSSEPMIRGNQECRDLVDEAKDYLLLPDQRAALQGPRTRPRRPGRCHEVLYAVGGWCSGDAMSMVERYDWRLNEWKVVTAMSKRRCGVGVAVLNDFLYSIGGHDGTNYLNSIERYDPKTSQWSSAITPTSTCRTSFGVAVLNGFIYVVGGQDGVSCLTNVERYDPAANSWKSVAPMLSRRLGVAVAALDGFLYAVGGSDGSAPLNTVERYNPQRDEWESVAPMLARRKHLGAACLDGKLYAAGGRNDTTELSSVESYDPATNQWTSVVAMATRRSGVGLAVVNKKLFAIGGFDGTTYLKSVEWYDKSANQWKMAQCMNYRRLGGGFGVLPGYGLLTD